MLNISRHLLLVFIVLLQLIAPLVHAHAGKQFSGFGVHLPGFEKYDLNHSEVLVQAVNSISDSEAVIIGVNTGIEQSSLNLVSDSDDSPFIISVFCCLLIALLVFEINFSPPTAPLVARLFSTSHSPRAPPAQ